MTPQPRPSILLVEDDPDDRVILLSAFKREAPDVHVEAVEEPTAALKRLDEIRLSGDLTEWIVITDLKLGASTGIELIQGIRSDPALLSLVVLVMSTSQSQADIGASYRAGCNGYFAKPMSLTDTRALAGELCRYWFGQHRSLRA